MALSSELVRHLNDQDSFPLEKRLKLAENAFTSPDLVAPRKQDIIFDWLCNTVSKNENNIAWKTLKECMDYHNHHGSSMNLKAPVKTALINTLSNGLEKQGQHNAEFILQCCRSILIDSSELQKSFISNPEVYIEILGKLLTQPISSEKDKNEFIQLNLIIVEAVEKLLKYYKQCSDKLKVRKLFVSELLHSLCKFAEKHSNEQLKTTIVRSIEKIIFDKFDVESEFIKEILHCYSEKILDETETINVSKYIFQAGIFLNKSSPSNVDFIYRNLLNNAKNQTMKIIMCSIFNGYLNNVTLDSKNEIAGMSLLNFHHNIIGEILSMNFSFPAAYECIGSIARINPLAIEAKLTDIFTNSLLEKRSSDILKNEYTSMMSEIFDCCVRLRRDQKLVSLILISLNQALIQKKDIEGIYQNDVLPEKFIEKFTFSIRNMMNSQATSVLTSFIYHLDILLQSDKIFTADVLKVSVTSRLCIAFFEGIPVADQTWPLTVQKKFVNNLMNLGKTLEKLANQLREKFTASEYYKEIFKNLLAITNTWDMLIGLFKHYSPETLPEEIFHSALEISKLVNGPIKTEDCNTKKSKIIALVDENPQKISHLDSSQISKLARFLVKDVEKNKSVEKISSHSVRCNRDLVIALIFETFTGIASGFDDNSGAVSKMMLNKLGDALWTEKKQLQKTLKSFKKILIEPLWINISNIFSTDLKLFLRILLSLPLMYCCDQLKVISFLLIFSLKKENSTDFQILNLCNRILSDISESCNFDILQYIPLEIIVEDLKPETTVIISRVLESSLMNLSNLQTLRSFVKENNENEKFENATVVFMESLEKIKLKLKSAEEKKVIEKIEKLLQAKLLKSLNNNIKSSDELKRLTIVIKHTAPSKEKLEESLQEIINTTLDSIFGADKIDNLQSSKECLQFIKVVLQYKSRGIILKNTTVKNIWSLMMKQSSSEIIPLLIEATDGEILGVILNLLQRETIGALKKTDDNSDLEFENYLIVWQSIVKAEMGAIRMKTRQKNLHTLIQSFKIMRIPSENNRANILELFSIIAGSKRMHINEKTVDLIFLITNYLIAESMSINVCKQILQLCSAFLKIRPAMSVDRLSILLHLYKKSFRFIVDQSKENSISQQQIILLALEIQKLASLFIKLKKDLARISPYVIADLIEMYSAGVIPFHVKEPLDDSLGLFLSICDQHAISLLNRVLPASIQEIFKTLHESYHKFYKFTGQI